MSKHKVRNLLVAVLALVGILIVLESNQRDDSIEDGQLLFPQLKDQINEITSISIRRSGDAEASTISRTSDVWAVTARQGYPADVGKIRQLLLAIADAKIVEQKTSNPERYAQLGVQDLQDPGSTSVLVNATGPDIAYDLIVGNSAQTNFRYVRVANASESWLIDKNPTIPETIGGWLAPDIVNIESKQIQSVTITHADGEKIQISKATEEDEDYGVGTIPDGRELSYATVANSIANGLQSLTLEDVRPATEFDESATRSVFSTFDGLQVVVVADKTDEESWLSVEASTSEESAEAISDEAAKINERTSGWQFKVTKSAADGLTNRWEDILKPEEDTE